MSSLSFGFLGGAAVLAVALASVQVQLAKAGSVPSELTESNSVWAASGGEAHSGH
jgi:hypothetical protein